MSNWANFSFSKKRIGAYFILPDFSYSVQVDKGVAPSPKLVAATKAAFDAFNTIFSPGEPKGDDEDSLTRLHTLRAVADYHEDMGDVIWWHLPIQEPPVVGGGPGAGEQTRDGEPTICQRMHDDAWFTHFTPLPKSEDLTASDGAKVGE